MLAKFTAAVQSSAAAAAESHNIAKVLLGTYQPASQPTKIYGGHDQSLSTGNIGDRSVHVIRAERRRWKHNNNNNIIL